VFIILLAVYTLATINHYELTLIWAGWNLWTTTKFRLHYDFNTIFVSSFYFRSRKRLL